MRSVQVGRDAKYYSYDVPIYSIANVIRRPSTGTHISVFNIEKIVVAKVFWDQLQYAKLGATSICEAASKVLQINRTQPNPVRPLKYDAMNLHLNFDGIQSARIS